jgi:hypothetical protein
MAVALDVAGSGTLFSATTSPVTYTGLTTGGSLSNGAIVVMIMFQDSTGSPTISGVTWGGQAMTAITGTAGANSAATAQVALYGLVGITNFGAQNLVISFGAGNFDFVVCACSWTGVNQSGGSTSFPNGNLATGTSTSPAVTITSATGDAVMACVADAGSGGVSSTGNTQLFTNNVSNINTGGQRAAGAASVSCTATLSASDTWVISGTDIAAAAAAASGFGIGTNHPPRGFLPMQRFNMGLRPTQAFPGPPVPPFVPMMLDMSRASRKQQWINFDNVPQFYPTQAPTTVFSMPDMSVKTRAKHWIDTALAIAQVTTTPTPSSALPAMPDVGVKTKVAHWIDPFFPLQAQPVVFYGAPALPARSWGNRNRSIADLTFPFYPLPPTPRTAAFTMPDMSVASRKQRLLDLSMPFVQPAQTPTTAAFALPDMQKGKKQQWLDLFLPLVQVAAAVTTPYVLDMRWFDMPVPRRVGARSLLQDIVGFPVTGACYLLQEDGVSRIILEDDSGFLELENCTPLQTLLFDQRWWYMPPGRKQQWLDLFLPIVVAGSVTPITPSRVLQMMPDMTARSHRQQWLDLLLPLPISQTQPATTPSAFQFPLPDVSIPSRKKQWLEIIEVPPLPLISLGAPALVDMSIPSRKNLWLDMSLPRFPTTQVGPTTPSSFFDIRWLDGPKGRKQQWLDPFMPIYGPLPRTPSIAAFALPDVSIPSKKRQWLDLFLPIYGPLPPTPTTAAFTLLDMTTRTRQQQWLDLFLPLPQFVTGPPTPSFAIPMMMEELPSMRSRKQQWLDLPAILFYPTLPRTPSSFFDDRWLDMPKPRPFLIEATQGLIGLQTTVTPPVVVPVYTLPRFRRDPWDRDEWGRIRPGSGYHGV